MHIGRNLVSAIVTFACSVASLTMVVPFSLADEVSDATGALCEPTSLTLGDPGTEEVDDAGAATYVGGNMYIGDPDSDWTSSSPTGSYAAEAEGLTVVKGDFSANLLKGFFTMGTVALGSNYRPAKGSIVLSVWTPSSSTALTANTATSVPEGLYLVIDTYDGSANSTQSVPMIVGSTLADADVNPEGSTALSLGTIDLKNTTSVVTKQVTDKDGASDQTPDYNIGDTVYFTLTTKIPNYDGYDSDSTLQDPTETRLLSLTDTFQTGSFTNQTIEKVTVSSSTTALTLGTDYDVVNGLSNTPPTLTVDLKKLVNGYTGASTTWKSGDTVTVLVSAKLSSTTTTTDTSTTAGAGSTAEGSDEYGADANGNYNKVTLNYSNTPSDNSQQNKVPGDTVNVYSFEFNVNKTASNGTTSLAGAQFTISDASGNYYKFDGTEWTTTTTAPTALSAIDPNSTALPDKTSDGIFISGTNGKIAVKGLKAGTYTVTEIKAPAGYLDLTLPSYTVTVGANYTQDDDNQAAGSHAGDNWLSGLTYTYTDKPATGLVVTTDNNSTATVKNITSITQLPKTGAAGIALFSIVGLMLVAAAAVFGIRARKASHLA